MTDVYDTVVAALPRLTAEEQDRVLERLHVLRSLAPADPGLGRARSGEDEILEAISLVVLRAAGEVAPSVALRRTPQFSGLRSKVPALEAFAAEHAPDRTRRRALFALGFDLLRAHLAAIGLPVTARTLMAHAHRLPAALDAAFPGYARAGLLGMVLVTEEDVR